MKSDFRERLEEFLVWCLEKLSRVGYRSRDADELQQAFFDELGKKLDELDDRIDQSKGD
jgi:hypothetical protein